jgi:LysR family transcriptional regulator, hydrogen peroxide-inducible genes activator
MAAKLNFSLTQLEYVLAVHQFGHFSQAARHCNVTQPTLSMQIQKLEEELGTVIFDRSKKPILLTDEGKKLIDQIRATLFEAKKIEVILEATAGGPLRGELTLGVIPTVAPYLLPRLLPSVEKLYPELRLKILELETHRIVNSLDNDEIDLGILATPLNIPRLTEHFLYWEPFSVLCRKGHPLTKLKWVKHSALQTDDIWLLEEGHCLRNQVLDLCAVAKRKTVPRKFQFESGSLETLKNLVNSYGGYTLLPALASESIPPQAMLLPFERPIPAREIGIVARREHYKKPLQEALATAVQAAVPESLRKIRKQDLDLLPVE